MGLLFSEVSQPWDLINSDPVIFFFFSCPDNSALTSRSTVGMQDCPRWPAALIMFVLPLGFLSGRASPPRCSTLYALSEGHSVRELVGGFQKCCREKLSICPRLTCS